VVRPERMLEFAAVWSRQEEGVRHSQAGKGKSALSIESY